MMVTDRLARRVIRREPAEYLQSHQQVVCRLRAIGIRQLVQRRAIKLDPLAHMAQSKLETFGRGGELCAKAQQRASQVYRGDGPVEWCALTLTHFQCGPKCCCRFLEFFAFAFRAL